MDDITTTRASTTTDRNRHTFSVQTSLKQEEPRSSLNFLFDSLASFLRRDTSFDSVRDIEFVEDQLTNDNGDDLLFEGDQKSLKIDDSCEADTACHNSKLISLNDNVGNETERDRKGSNKHQSRHIRYLSAPSKDIIDLKIRLEDEETPLLTNKKRIGRRTKSLFYGKEVGNQKNTVPVMLLSDAQKDRLVRLSAAFLMDYERSRPPTLHGNIEELTDRHLQLRALRFSKSWSLATVVSAVCLFVAPYIEQTFTEKGNRYIFFVLCTVIPAIICFVDLEINRYLRHNVSSGTSQDQLSRRNIGPRGRQRQVDFYLSISLWLICAESAMDLVRGQGGIVWSRVLTPIALFYVFPEARDSFSAFRQVIPQLVGILTAQLSAELFFATVALLYFGSHYTDKFGTLQLSFINLYQLAITVVNPSLWLDIYDDNHSSAIFFVVFQFVCNIYFHSLVLSTVFHAYLRALKQIRMRRLIDREDALGLAFQSLCTFDSFKGAGNSCFVPCAVVKRVLRDARPYYSEKMIHYLFRHFIANPGEHSLNYDTFRTRISMALSVSLRAKKYTRRRHIMLKIYKAALSIANLVFVVLATMSMGENKILGQALVPFGVALTFSSLVDILVSFLSSNDSYWLSGIVFDVSAIVAFLVSFYGVFLWFYGIQANQFSIALLVTGRVIDLLRVLRLFFQHGEIARRIKQAWLCATGPLILLLAAMHCIVHVGVALWRNLIVVGSTQGIEPRYDVQNFNSFPSGMLTIFNIAIGNDWNAIVAVFLTTSRPTVVYPFFMAAREISCVLISVLSAFFIQDSAVPAISAIVSQEEERSDLEFNRSKTFQIDDILQSSYDIVPRKSTDAIMSKLLMEKEEVEDELKKISHTLNLFYSLASDDGAPVGFMLCCQSMVRFCNFSFKKVTHEFLSEETIHVVVSEMHIDLLALGDKGDANALITRQFPHPSEAVNREEKCVLEIRASLLRTDPPISLFISKCKWSEVKLPINKSRIEFKEEKCIRTC